MCHFIIYKRSLWETVAMRILRATLSQTDVESQRVSSLTIKCKFK